MKPINDQLDPLTATDDEILNALVDADTASIMLCMVHLTGDMNIIRGSVKPTMEFMAADEGISEEDRQQVLTQALEILKTYRDSPSDLFKPNADELLEMLRFLAGEEMSDEHVEFLTSELSMNGEDPYGQPAIFEVPEEKRQQFEVLVIGAGMSGLLTAIRLKEAGISFQVVEKNEDVGGTWYENRYPGCRVDSANHTYSYSFKPKDWPQHFSQQEILREYFSDTANEFGLREHISFQTEVSEARFDEASGKWQVQVVSDGETRLITANAVISAVGQLNRPNIPNIPGAESFNGVSFHSARWQHELDLSGKRIGVIGTGGSAFQFAPILAEQAESMTLFQRTPPWIVPNPGYFEEVPTGVHWLQRHVPFYAKWFRFKVFWRSAEGMLAAARADEGWNRPEESVGEVSQLVRDMFLENLRGELEGRDDLLEKCTPHYPPFAKRMLIDDGKYLRTLKRDNVELVTEQIDCITPNGVRTTDGVEHEFDVLVYGTGFKASEFLFPMKVYGLGGAELHEQWADDPQAYKGVTVPGFPNLFCTYGPNTNIVVNGSIIFFSECEVRYILGCLALLMEKDGSYMDVKQDVCDEYNVKINEGNAKMAWGQSNVNTWYKNASGKITQNWPGTLIEFWQQTRNADESEYQITRV
jgi:4-hydroxyacetophenone monooxygenase